MVSLFQGFEFSYQDGVLFYDHSGALSRRLQEVLPGLAFKSAVFDQRDFVLPAQEIELFFGVAASHIHTLTPSHQEFPTTAAGFLRIVTEVLELSHLKDFRFRYVLGRPCASDEEAQKLMWPLVPQDSKDKLSNLAAPPQWQALQGEYIVNNLYCQSRIAVLPLVPHPKLTTPDAKAGQQLPHITVQLDVRGLLPIAVADFDAEGFINHVREAQSRDILSKLASHLS